MTVPLPSAAVLAARARRAGRAGADAARIEWFINEVSSKVQLTLRQRMGIAVGYMVSKVVKNISIPVVKNASGRAVERSRPGEFPRADTTLLMKSIFGETRVLGGGAAEGYIGTPVDYGVILETSESLDRQFLQRTLREELPRLRAILTGPIK